MDDFFKNYFDILLLKCIFVSMKAIGTHYLHLKYLANSREAKKFYEGTKQQLKSTNVVLCKSGKISKVIITFPLYSQTYDQGFVVFEKIGGK
jgi:hypothetical protein